MFETNPENAPIIERLAAMLAELPMGETLTYVSMSKAVRRDLVGRNRHLLTQAREHAEKQLGCIFDCVRKIGIKRLASPDCPEVGLVAMRRVRKVAKRGAKRLNRLNVNSLSESETKRVVAYRSMLGAIALVADGNKARTLAAVVVDPVNPIPPADILQMFLK